MDFDHLSDKDFNISRWLKSSLNYQHLWQEIRKCDLVCANCHRIRTQQNTSYSDKHETKITDEDINFILEKLLEYGLSDGFGVESSKLDCECSTHS